MFAKVKISGVLETITGLHIGGSSAFSAIGAVDSPVIRDARTNMPMIPGSSLKGKLRTLLAKKYNQTVAKTPDDDAVCLTSLFGSAKKGQVKTSKILFHISISCMVNYSQILGCCKIMLQVCKLTFLIVRDRKGCENLRITWSRVCSR